MTRYEGSTVVLRGKINADNTTKMGDARAEISLPAELSITDARKSLIRALSEMDIQITRDERESGSVRITGETPPSLLSWGEEIHVKITADKIEIVSKSPSQIIDWGKSNNNVKQIQSSVRDYISDSGNKSLA